MNRSSNWNRPTKFLFRNAIKLRWLLPKKKSKAFGISVSSEKQKIGQIYVINLNRQPTRLVEIKKELKYILDYSGKELLNLTKRFVAIDAKNFQEEPKKDKNINPLYTLEDQLFVEPQPLAIPNKLELNSPIRMSRSEIAVARSHIEIWKKVAAGDCEYVLILEDDVWFKPNFVSHLNEAWEEIERDKKSESYFDIFYLSYEEVKNGAPKTFLSKNVFRPDRGLWHLSGYILSRVGAKKLLELLPCSGPVDLWINHQFKFLDVRATRKSIISQRPDISSTNSYSILPKLTKIGAITSESASLFQIRPNEKPVFAFGPKGSGLSSLAMALSMLGYRCCSDLQELPKFEQEKLLSRDSDRIFDAYVNVGSLLKDIHRLKKLYPNAKFIITSSKGVCNDKEARFLEDLKEADKIVLTFNETNRWQVICEHLRCAPPACNYPELTDIGQRRLSNKNSDLITPPISGIPKWDKSPWIIEQRDWWHGIHSASLERNFKKAHTPIKIKDSLEFLDTKKWFIRNDTFTDNFALFRNSNIDFRSSKGALFSIKKESLGVRDYSAASLTSCDQYLYGKFEVNLRASNNPGVITGFFLHRNSPRQEIDIEIAGNKPDRLIVNVFYNPGSDGAKFDYGYRGAPVYIDLGFDASKSNHLYAIEWKPGEICWFVDNQLVHRRTEWNPTPIPHLPMSLHVNLWPTRSKKLAGRLSKKQLPANAEIRSVKFETTKIISHNKNEYSIL